MTNDNGAPNGWDNCTVIDRRDLAEDLAVFRVKPDGDLFDFRAGQYTVIGLCASAPRLESSDHPYYKARTHVVRLRAGDGMGTGFVVSESGQIVTNPHVVGNDDAPSVETYEGETFAAKTLRRSSEADLALVQVDPPSGEWVPMRVELVALPEVGSDVYVIGHPVGLGWTITRGIVSAVRRAGEVAPTQIIQTDAAISPGNSGGPLLDRHGHLVGVVVSKLAGPGIESVGFAIPVSETAAFMAQGERAGS